MFDRLRNLVTRKPGSTGSRPAAARGRGNGRPVRTVVIRGKYDAAQTTYENRNHWANADSLAANAAMNPQVRRILRNRARYEVANNSYAKGIVLTLANYVVGTGPRLQMRSGDPNVDAAVEWEFSRWAIAVGLAHKLRTMRISQCESGECFGLLATNRRVDSPVKLDLRLIEADQVATPWPVLPDFSNPADGIDLDEWGNPLRYHVLRRHPGSTAGVRFGFESDPVPAASMIHLFRAERPGQNRGIPELTPALPLFALLRRYTLAVVTAAEAAALPSGVIYTDAPADSDDADNPEPMDEIEVPRGVYTTMPYGWKMGQVKAEQPTTVYGDFKREVLNEIARCLNIPFNIAAGNSAKHNYASGRLDHQAFFKAIRIDQGYLGATVLDRILRAWLDEAKLVEGLLPQALRRAAAEIKHDWFWDGSEHVDPSKEANAQATRLSSHTTTLAEEFARQGKDWETELRQRARERELMQELGLSTEPPVPAADTEEEDEEVEETAGSE